MIGDLEETRSSEPARFVRQRSFEGALQQPPPLLSPPPVSLWGSLGREGGQILPASTRVLRTSPRPPPSRRPDGGLPSGRLTSAQTSGPSPHVCIPTGPPPKARRLTPMDPWRVWNACPPPFLLLSGLVDWAHVALLYFWAAGEGWLATAASPPARTIGPCWSWPLYDLRRAGGRHYLPPPQLSCAWGRKGTALPSPPYAAAALSPPDVPRTLGTSDGKAKANRPLPLQDGAGETTLQRTSPPSHPPFPPLSPPPPPHPPPHPPSSPPPLGGGDR